MQLYRVKQKVTMQTNYALFHVYIARINFNFVFIRIQEKLISMTFLYTSINIRQKNYS